MPQRVRPLPALPVPPTHILQLAHLRAPVTLAILRAGQVPYSPARHALMTLPHTQENPIAHVTLAMRTCRVAR